MPYSCQTDETAEARNSKLGVPSSDASKSFVQFLLVGGVCFVLGTFALYVLTEICKIHYLLSTLLASLLASGVGFWLNRRFAFREQASHFWRELLRYYLVNTGALGLNLALMATCVSVLHFPYLVASVFLSAAITISNFLIHRFWSFGKR